MNSFIVLVATSLREKADLSKMQLIKIRGCNRNENCVYFSSTDYIVYEITDNPGFDRDNFMREIPFFTDKISDNESGLVFDFIIENDKRIKVEEEKPVSYYTDDPAEQLALAVLRKKPHCNFYEFRSLAFDIAIEKGYSRAIKEEAIRFYA